MPSLSGVPRLPSAVQDRGAKPGVISHLVPWGAMAERLTWPWSLPQGPAWLPSCGLLASIFDSLVQTGISYLNSVCTSHVLIMF